MLNRTTTNSTQAGPRMGDTSCIGPDPQGLRSLGPAALWWPLHRFESRDARITETKPGSRRTDVGLPLIRKSRRQAEIYFQPFPGPGPKTQISVGGGTFRAGVSTDASCSTSVPRSPDGRVDRPGQLRARGGPSPRLVHVAGRRIIRPSPDGQQFLVTTVVSEASPITLILNWRPLNK